MKNILFICALIAASLQSFAQQVPKQVVAEHFTNTYCSICASRNPGLYSNLGHYPQVLHIAYYPSSPYPSCPLNQYNVTNNDARTNFYGIYGATPRLVVGGDIISAPFTDTSIFTSRLPQTSSFSLSVSLNRSSPDSLTTRIVVTRHDTGSYTSATLWAAISEDTLLFTAANGETYHYNVFRESLWGVTPLPVTLPAIIGDSIVLTRTATWDNLWRQDRVSVTAILQQADKKVIQAARSASLPQAVAIGNIEKIACSVYPNPAGKLLYINPLGQHLSCVLYSASGNRIFLGMLDGQLGSFNISNLDPGHYSLHLYNGRQTVSIPVTKL